MHIQEYFQLHFFASLKDRHILKRPQNNSKMIRDYFDFARFLKNMKIEMENGQVLNNYIVLHSKQQNNGIEYNIVLKMLE